MEAQKGFNGLPGWAKGIIAVAGTAAAIIGGYKMYQYYEKKAAEKDSQAVANGADSEYKKELQKGGGLSFPQTNYEALANTLVKLFDGCESTGSEIQAIKEIIKGVKNKTDWYFLIKIFGNRDIADCGTFGFGKTNYDLITLLKDQLDTQLLGESINGKIYWYNNSLDALTDYLKTIGITI